MRVCSKHRVKQRMCVCHRENILQNKWAQGQMHTAEFIHEYYIVVDAHIFQKNEKWKKNIQTQQQQGHHVEFGMSALVLCVFSSMFLRWNIVNYWAEENVWISELFLILHMVCFRFGLFPNSCLLSMAQVRCCGDKVSHLMTLVPHTFITSHLINMSELKIPILFYCGFKSYLWTKNVAHTQLHQHRIFTLFFCTSI